MTDSLIYQSQFFLHHLHQYCRTAAISKAKPLQYLKSCSWLWLSNAVIIHKERNTISFKNKSQETIIMGEKFSAESHLEYLSIHSFHCHPGSWYTYGRLLSMVIAMGRRSHEQHDGAFGSNQLVVNLYIPYRCFHWMVSRVSGVLNVNVMQKTINQLFRFRIDDRNANSSNQVKIQLQKYEKKR